MRADLFTRHANHRGFTAGNVVLTSQDGVHLVQEKLQHWAMPQGACD